MVVQTDQGPVTILFMPATAVDDGERMAFDQQHALLVQLERGSAAIIGQQMQTVEKVEGIIRTSLKTAPLDA